MANLPPIPTEDVKSLEPVKKMPISFGAIPTSYLVALSYEEQLLWLCNYLETTVIPTVNSFSEAITELQNLFIQVRDYVAQFDSFINDTNDKINEFENTVNNIEKQFTTITYQLQTQFNDLKTYVDNYFANLDLTTEVQNILQQYIEEGKISAGLDITYNQSSETLTFTNIAVNYDEPTETLTFSHLINVVND